WPIQARRRTSHRSWRSLTTQRCGGVDQPSLILIPMVVYQVHAPDEKQRSTFVAEPFDDGHRIRHGQHEGAPISRELREPESLVEGYDGIVSGVDGNRGTADLMRNLYCSDKCILKQ